LGGPAGKNLKRNPKSKTRNLRPEREDMTKRTRKADLGGKVKRIANNSAAVHRRTTKRPWDSINSCTRKTTDATGYLPGQALVDSCRWTPLRARGGRESPQRCASPGSRRRGGYVIIAGEGKKKARKSKAGENGNAS